MTAALEGSEWSAARRRPYFTPGKDPVPILQEVGWALGPVWTGEKSGSHRDSISDRPAHSQSLYRLSYPAHYIYMCVCVCVCVWVSECMDRLCGLVVRVSGYSNRGPGFDPRRYQIFWVVVGLERGPLSLVRSVEELLEWKK